MKKANNVVDERNETYFYFISQFLNVISIVGIYNSKDSEEKEKIMEIFKININYMKPKCVLN